LPANGVNGHKNGGGDNAVVSPDEIPSSQIQATETLAGNGHTGWTPGFRANTSPEKALTFPRRNTQQGQDVFETAEWEKRTAAITGETGKSVFEQKDCEIPKNWSQLATNVVVSKYFRGPINTPQRETSVKQVIGRVADTLGDWGRKGGYFATEEDAQSFRDELAYYLLHQYGAFNSPVWFNLGVKGSRAQASACFINSVYDDMESIMELAATEARLFKGGSGAGSNLWRIRSSREQLSGGGIASGPVSFMRGWDSFAGAIKSGGTTRRAAKMVILNADHPDIEEFITCKATEEKKAWALIEMGYSGGWNVPGGAYDSVAFQNANHSVRVTDEFMRAAENNAEWNTRAVRDGKVIETKNARELLLKIAECTHLCGDPGLQYDTIINDWHTCANTDRIYASNPCSEFVFLDDTACNLSSLNLLKFYDFETGRFDAASYTHACETFLTAQEIIVSFASYPTAKIAENSELFRPLGLGYCNIGALLMAMGLAYDSDQGRAFAGALTAIMTGAAYRQSAKIAKNTGPFEGYARNKEPMLRVIAKHRAAVNNIDHTLVADNVMQEARTVWDDALMLGQKHGYRNAQATVLAPTGTISFMMDADTTGIEPDIALVKYKKLVGGGLLKIVNQTVPAALRKLAYNEDEIKSIVEYIDKNDTIEGAPGLRDEHLSVFDCAFKAMNGTRSIHHMGHIKMMAAAQPFLSGAISKTVNMPEDCSVEDIFDGYLQSWKLGVKAVAIYRDNSKRTQPLSTTTDAQKADKKEVDVKKANRRKLPDERQSITHKFSIAGQEGYFMVGLYDDGSPGELFIKMSKEGSTISGLMDSFAVSISMCLQYGVPLRVLVNKFSHTRFEPSGYTTNREIPIAKSLMDYIFRWFDLKFHPNGDNGHFGKPAPAAHTEEVEAKKAPEPVLAATIEKAPIQAKAPATKAPALSLFPTYDHSHANGAANGNLADAQASLMQSQQDSPPCPNCGAITVRSGACYKCNECGTTTGCG
jgi:ribonucleoside-diphosphate reductase alpha chain